MQEALCVRYDRGLIPTVAPTRAVRPWLARVCSIAPASRPAPAAYRAALAPFLRHFLTEIGLFRISGIELSPRQQTLVMMQAWRLAEELRPKYFALVGARLREQREIGNNVVRTVAATAARELTV